MPRNVQLQHFQMNIHEHQVKFMEDFESQGGISFILLFYTSLNEILTIIPFKDIKRFYDRSINGGRKSFRYEEIDKNYLIKSAPGALVHYLGRNSERFSFKGKVDIYYKIL